MNPELPGQPPKEEKPTSQERTKPTPEEEEHRQQWLLYNPEIVGPRLAEQEMQAVIKSLETALEYCEKEYPLQELYAITELTLEEASKHEKREALKQDLIPIVRALNLLEGRTSISSKKHGELKGRYRNLSRAVGMINKGKVDHTR